MLILFIHIPIYDLLQPYLGNSSCEQSQQDRCSSKEANRIICNVNRRASTDVLFRELRIIPFRDVNVYLVSRFMFRYIHGSVPALFAGYFQTNADIHSHNTRQALNFHLPNVKSNLGKWNLRYRGAQIWNHLLEVGIDSGTSELVFANCVKFHIRNGMFTA